MLITLFTFIFLPFPSFSCSFSFFLFSPTSSTISSILLFIIEVRAVFLSAASVDSGAGAARSANDHLAAL